MQKKYRLRSELTLAMVVSAIAAIVAVVTIPGSTEGRPSLDSPPVERLPKAERLPLRHASASAKKVISDNGIILCQALGPASPHPVWGVDSMAGCGRGEVGWEARAHINWQAYAQGEYVGHARLAHVPEYRIRVDDEISFVFRLTREKSDKPYEFQVGDTLRVESLTADGAENASGLPQDDIQRDLVIQPDGTLSLPLLGQVHAAGSTVEQLRLQLEDRYKRYYKEPSITVTPIKVNTRLQDLIESIDARQGFGGLRLTVSVTPAGKIYLPALGAICVQGLTLEELKYEVDARYAATIPGVALTPVLTQRAPRFMFVLGEVPEPGRFELQGPTTLMGAIALAGGWNQGANLRQVVVFRRGDDWRLMATMVDIRGALQGRRPTPADEIWLNDSDIVVVPKTPIEVVDEAIDQYFTRGLYSLFPQFVGGDFTFSAFRQISN